MRLIYAVLAVFLFSGGLFAINVGTCADGTQYGQCSIPQAGMYCTGSINAPDLQPYSAHCPCDKFPDGSMRSGYTEQTIDGIPTCVQQKCTEDGTPFGSCSPTKPKYCSSGTLIDKASVCNCSTGYHKEAERCLSNTGCVYHAPDCNSRQDCDTNVSASTYNTCLTKKGCQYDNPRCNVLSEDCNQNTGKCELKPGCVNANPACAEGEKCVNNKCIKPGLGFGNIDFTGGAPATNGTGNESGTTTGATGLSCCCLPAAGVGLIGLFAFSRKNEE
jgi:hypothetical protein